MEKKPGFQTKINGEIIMYIIIGILIFGFIFFMPNVYKLISNIKLGNSFDKTGEQNIENNVQNEEETIKSDVTLICTLMESEPEGNLEEIYIFYYNNNELRQISNEKKYDAIADEYLNYVYSEQIKFDNLNDLYKNVPGFSYNSKLESRMLKVNFLYDLTILELENLYNDDENLSIRLNVDRNQSLEEVKKIYEDLGYDCR